MTYIVFYKVLVVGETDYSGAEWRKLDEFYSFEEAYFYMQAEIEYDLIRCEEYTKYYYKIEKGDN